VCVCVCCEVTNISTCRYSRITSTKSPSFCMNTVSASLTNLTAVLPQSRDCSCYVSRPILAPPLRWLQRHTDLRALVFALVSDLWHQPRLADVTCARRRRLCGIDLAVHSNYVCHMLYVVPNRICFFFSRRLSFSPHDTVVLSHPSIPLYLFSTTVFKLKFSLHVSLMYISSETAECREADCNNKAARMFCCAFA
jgi:hypothetical protein